MDMNINYKVPYTIKIIIRKTNNQFHVIHNSLFF